MVIHGSVDGTEARSETHYDAAGRRTESIDPEGHRTGFVYDDGGRLLATVFDDGSSAAVAYYAAGRKVADSGPDGRRTEHDYDDAGRLIEVRLAAGTAEETVTTYGYNDLGQKISQTDAEGRTTTWESQVPQFVP